MAGDGPGRIELGAGTVAGVQGPVEILVRPEHAERAQELLAEEE